MAQPVGGSSSGAREGTAGDDTLTGRGGSGCWTACRSVGSLAHPSKGPVMTACRGLFLLLVSCVALAVAPAASAEVECDGIPRCTTATGPWVSVPTIDDPWDVVIWDVRCTGDASAAGSDWVGRQHPRRPRGGCAAVPEHRPVQRSRPRLHWGEPDSDGKVVPAARRLSEQRRRRASGGCRRPQWGHAPHRDEDGEARAARRLSTSLPARRAARSLGPAESASSRTTRRRLTSSATST